MCGVTGVAVARCPEVTEWARHEVCFTVATVAKYLVVKLIHLPRLQFFIPSRPALTLDGLRMACAAMDRVSKVGPGDKEQLGLSIERLSCPISQADCATIWLECDQV
ncbi:hypothetical protein, partial [uncultured Tateyamaria sp.]|uniref:hypothetical protein n=1 Tax=uncultured Tateyamaria sp. TaxID=455651 RepID=UPI00262B701B